MATIETALAKDIITSGHAAYTVIVVSIVATEQPFIFSIIIMNKKMNYGSDARTRIFEGAKKVAKAVIVTMGPSGKNAMIQRNGLIPNVTNDGVTVARSIVLSNNQENCGASLIKSAAEKTNRLAGDGTTTTTALTYSMVKEGLPLVDEKGINPFFFIKGMNSGLSWVQKTLKELTTRVSGDKSLIQNVADISSQDSEVASVLADIIEEVGEDSAITVEKGSMFGITKETVKGFQFDGGYVSNYFITNTDKMTAEINDAYVLVTDEKITSTQQIIGLMKPALESGKTKFLIVAESISGDALKSLVLNKLEKGLQVVCVTTRRQGEKRNQIFNDIADITGAKYITNQTGKSLKKARPDDLGMCGKVIVSEGKTIIVDGQGNSDHIDSRIQSLRAQIENEQDAYKKDLMKESLARLVGGVAVIRVGAATDVEMLNKIGKIEDALNATRAAIEEGYVAGGGVAMLNIADKMPKKCELDNEDAQKGYDALRNALIFPLWQIIENTGNSGDDVVKTIREQGKDNFGLNARTGDYGDMVEMGIIDPTKVIRIAVENAVSTAAMILTTDVIITNEEAPKPMQNTLNQ